MGFEIQRLVESNRSGMDLLALALFHDEKQR
jgi:hypothetical protein